MSAKFINLHQFPPDDVRFNFLFDPKSCLYTSKSSKVIKTIPAVEVVNTIAESGASIHQQLDKVLDALCSLPNDTRFVVDLADSCFVVFTFSHQEPTRSKFSLLCVQAPTKLLDCITARVFEWE